VLEDLQYDLAYLLIDGELPVARIAPVPRAGATVFIMGSPLGYENFNSVSLGIVAARQRDLSGYADYGWALLFQTTSPAFPGNSGGPVFCGRRVVGVLVAGSGETLNYAVPASVIDVEAVKTAFELERYRGIRAGL
jgi:S1-C subfamily serine protease